MDDWTETMTARDRIEAVALTLREPRSVNWIKKQAEVGSWETTKSQLEYLTDAGQLTTVEIDGDTRYKIDPMRAYLDHIQELVVENTKDELRDELEEIASEIATWKREYDVDSLQELEASLGEEFPPEEVRDRRKVITYWEENKHHRQLLTNALGLYDDLSAQDYGTNSSHPQHAD
ncbi:hypothetical protein RBH26_14490 [Natronolimnohabitans sp. A-GB9]|uniref:DUF7342 family protein n=1 Tax=Natronolimnohabitans sp. A-GB9 TaxID=3069757 RepID=UPI0027ADB2D0|nr:hypothetical protein [Natronolimnohabitans sp. A-GB9]MDQ2051685.1 hypothetical protein [Natronolimnohabitans sp. A-GB9]